MKVIIAVVLITLFSSFAALAQEAKKLPEGTKWKQILKVNYEVGKRDQALAIIRDYFVKASKNAGIPRPELMEMMTGDYDVLVVWTLNGGTEDLNWEMHPNDVKWMKAMTEIAGGEDKAMEVLTEYYSLIDSVETDLAIVKK